MSPQFENTPKVRISKKKKKKKSFFMSCEYENKKIDLVQNIIYLLHNIIQSMSGVTIHTYFNVILPR